MSRYIDVDELLALIPTIEDEYKYCRKIINNIPTADVVEVVRCKDCKYRKIEFGWNGKRYKMCANTDYPTDDDAYCSYGERREDGTT